MKLTVIVLVFNEVKTIIQAIKDIEKIKVPSKEVIIMDNCSTDGTKELLQQLKTDKYRIVFNEENITSGSIINGIKLAKGEYIFLHHTDLEYDPSDAMRMLEVAEAGGYDLVLGSRLKNNKNSKWRIIINRPAYLATIITTFLINCWYGKNLTDIIGGHLFRTSSIRTIPINDRGAGYIFENISRVCKRGLKITEVAISYRPRSWKEGKKVRPHELINALLSMLRVKVFG